MNRFNLRADLRPFMQGRCFDFALALNRLIPGSELVAFGSAKFPDHVAVRIPASGQLIDVRGPLDLQDMVAGMQGAAAALADGPIPVTVDQVALHIGQRAEGLKIPIDARKAAKERLAAFVTSLQADNAETPILSSPERRASPRARP